jgi:hypothetical protein
VNDDCKVVDSIDKLVPVNFPFCISDFSMRLQSMCLFGEAGFSSNRCWIVTKLPQRFSKSVRNLLNF